MATDFTKTDISSAVASSTATALGGPERKALANAVYTAHKGGTGVLPAFRAAYPGTLTPEIEAAFDTAVQAAKTQRLAVKATKTGGTPPPDPAVTRQGKLSQVTAARNATKTAADTADSTALAAETDDETAAKAATEAERLRPGSSEATDARTAADAAHTAAQAARTASNNAAAKFKSANTAENEAETGVKADGSGTAVDIDIALGNARAAQKAAERFAEQAADEAKQALRAREKAEKALSDAKEAPETLPQAVLRKLRERAVTYSVLGGAMALVLVAWVFGLPFIIVGMIAIAILAVAIWATLQSPTTGRTAAAALAAVAIVAFGLALLLRSGAGNGLPLPNGGAPTATATATTRGDGVFKTFATLPSTGPTMPPATP